MSFQKVVPLGKEVRWYDGLLLRQGTVKSIHQCLKYFKCLSNNFMALLFDSIATPLFRPRPERLGSYFALLIDLTI